MCENVPFILHMMTLLVFRINLFYFFYVKRLTAYFLRGRIKPIESLDRGAVHMSIT